VPGDELAAFAAVLPGDVRLVVGGATRTASVRAALAAVARPVADAVLVHDAARPLTPPDVVARVLARWPTVRRRSCRCCRSSTPP
jgi:2-C-methyl-D-erythritol 4-phosphate cytidylyltransferase